MAIHTGRIQELIILRHRKDGVYLGDDEGNEVLLPITDLGLGHAQRGHLLPFLVAVHEHAQRGDIPGIVRTFGDG